MATRAKALKKFAKNFLHHDLTGMSETAVLKDLLKKEFNIDAIGNSVVSVLMNAVSNDGGADNPDFQFVLSDAPYIAVGGRQYGECYFIDIPIASFTVDGVTYDSSTPEAMEAITYTLTINGKDYEYGSNQQTPFDCSEILDNTVVSVTLVGHYQGIDSAPFQFEGYIYG